MDTADIRDRARESLHKCFGSGKTVSRIGRCGGVRMGNQRTFASMAWNGKGKVTRRERFLGEMDAVIPWPRLVRVVEPHYPKAGQGRFQAFSGEVRKLRTCSGDVYVSSAPENA